MTQLLMVGSSPITMQQRISAGNDFDGDVPGGGSPLTPTLEPGWIKYSAADEGGKFLFGQDKPQVLRILQLWIKFGGQTAWSLSVVNGTDEVVAFSGTTETELFVFGEQAALIIPPGWFLKLVTSGASTAMFANVTAVGHGADEAADGLV